MNTGALRENVSTGEKVFLFVFLIFALLFYTYLHACRDDKEEFLHYIELLLLGTGYATLVIATNIWFIIACMVQWAIALVLFLIYK